MTSVLVLDTGRHNGDQCHPLAPACMLSAWYEEYPNTSVVAIVNGMAKCTIHFCSSLFKNFRDIDHSFYRFKMLLNKMNSGQCEYGHNIIILLANECES